MDDIRTLCDMLLSASDHVLERYDSERDRFISRSRELASQVRGMLDESELLRAAKVIALTPETRGYLSNNDPKALEQLNAAIMAADPSCSPPHVVAAAACDIMPKVNGVPFRCSCGCNVFRRASSNKLRCNGCSEDYIAE